LDKRIGYIAGIVVTLAGGIGTASAQAVSPPQAPTDAQLGDIIVTANKRTETAQSSPVAITAITPQALSDKGVTSLLKLNDAVPGVQVDTTIGQSVVFLRGIGPQNNFPQYGAAVPFQVDGVDIQRETFATGLFDVRQVEILRGPQGTLYGRNALAGVVNVTTNEPVGHREGAFEVEAGNYNMIRTAGMLNLPITDTLSLRAAFQTLNRDGYLSNGAGRLVTQAGRLEALFTPSSNFDLLVTGSVGHQGGTTEDWVARTCGYTLPSTITAPPGCGTTPHKYGLINSDNPWFDGQSTAGNFERQNNWGMSARANIRFAGGLKLTAIGSYAHARQDQRSLVGPTAVTSHVQDDQNTQEIRLAKAAPKKAGSLNWVVGLYRFAAKVPFSAEVNPPVTQPTYFPTVLDPTKFFPPIPGAFVQVSEPQIDLNSYAAFGQGSYAITDRLRVTGGGRISWDRVEGQSGFGPNFLPASLTSHHYRDSHIDWKVGVDMDVGDRSLVYGNIQTGYISGGFSLGPNNYKPATLLAFSLGSKNRFLDNRLEVNAEAYYYAYKDYQLAFNNPVSGLQEIFNADKVSVKGAEFSVTYKISRNDTIYANVALLDAKIDKFLAPFATTADPANTTIVLRAGQNLSGFQLIQAPHVAAGAGYEHVFDLASGATLSARIDSHFETSHYGDFQLERSNYSPSFVKTNIALNYRSAKGGWHAGVYVYNLENSVSFGQGGPYAGTYIAPPRTYGAKVGFNF
jgi:iron complex outermembrane receptor protein